MLVMLAIRAVGMGLSSGRRRHEGLTGQDNVAWLVFLLEIGRDFWMIGRDIADQPSEKAA